jgi:hypothetical protein
MCVSRATKKDAKDSVWQSDQTPDFPMQSSMVFLAKFTSSQVRSSSFLMFLAALWDVIGLRARVPSTCVRLKVSWLAAWSESLDASAQPRLVK